MSVDSETERSAHKVIEKRRRDRINNCLVELSQTVPSAFAKQTSGKLEKAEILEMTVEYLRAIQATDSGGSRFENGEWCNGDIWADFIQHYQQGYSDCMRQVVRYMTDVEGMGLNDARCVRILSYLQTRFLPDSPINGRGRRETSQPNLSSDKIPCRHPLPRSVHRYSPYSVHPSTRSAFSPDIKPCAVTTTNIYPFTSSSDQSLFKSSNSLPLNILNYTHNTNRHTIISTPDKHRHIYK